MKPKDNEIVSKIKELKQFEFSLLVKIYIFISDLIKFFFVS